jgi:molybdate transport system regulatory protein
MEPRLKIWVAFDQKTKFGDGRARLLELIDQLGSINKAVSRIGMSYRTAWGYIQELESAAGFRFLERRPGGGAQGGARLTKDGQRFLCSYWDFRKGLESVVTRQFGRAFKPWRRSALRTGRPRRS